MRCTGLGRWLGLVARVAMPPGTIFASQPLVICEGRMLGTCAWLATLPVAVGPGGGGSVRQAGLHWVLNGRSQRHHELLPQSAMASSSTAMVPDMQDSIELPEFSPDLFPASKMRLQQPDQKQTGGMKKTAKVELDLNGKPEHQIINVDAAAAVDDSLKIENLNLSPETVKALEKKGIVALFPIQKHVFDPASQGRDLIGRAKTGSGKTIAFALPVIESLLKENRTKASTRGRTPRCLVMTPTRELANQVAREFGSVAPSLSLGCFYGGVPAGSQKRLLADGVDVVVGTPGRLIDLIQQKALDLSQIRFAVLDESDQMLDMGFEVDMERILKYAPSNRQTLLFSATLPAWVKKVSKKYLNNHVLVDLVGDQATGRIVESIRPLGVLVDRRAKCMVAVDLLVVHGAGERTILFTQTKREADFVASSITTTVPCEALHGDIPQQQRELTLERFRLGKFSVLVATDVAARGLDIPNVDLVIHYDIPQDSEHFLHRSGRTGRAGKSGTTIVMFTKPEAREVQRVMRETHTNLEMIGPPAPREVMQASTKSVLSRIGSVEPEVMKFFSPAAEKLLSKDNGHQVLAAALASISGFMKVPKPRSLLTQEEGMVSLRILGEPGRLEPRSEVLRIVKRLAGQEAVARVGRIETFLDNNRRQQCAVLDLPAEHAVALLQAAAKAPDGRAVQGLAIDRPRHLPFSFCLSQSGMDDIRASGHGQRGRGGRGMPDRMNGFSDRQGGGGWRSERRSGRGDASRRANGSWESTRSRDGRGERRDRR